MNKTLKMVRYLQPSKLITAIKVIPICFTKTFSKIRILSKLLTQFTDDNTLVAVFLIEQLMIIGILSISLFVIIVLLLSTCASPSPLLTI